MKLSSLIPIYLSHKVYKLSSISESRKGIPTLEEIRKSELESLVQSRYNIKEQLEKKVWIGW